MATGVNHPPIEFRVQVFNRNFGPPLVMMIGALPALATQDVLARLHAAILDFVGMPNGSLSDGFRVEPTTELADSEADLVALLRKAQAERDELAAKCLSLESEVEKFRLSQPCGVHLYSAGGVEELADAVARGIARAKGK